jgi:hypothetical protein
MLASISSQHAESDSCPQGNPSRFRQVEIRSNVSRIVSVELAGEDLAAVDAWREVHRFPTIEAAVEELLRRALMDEISGIEDLVVKARARLGLGMAADDGEG